MRTKQRGLKRKCRNMVRRIEEETEAFPPYPGDCDYWHLHLPLARALVNSRAVPFKVRRLCVQTLLRRAHHLAIMAPHAITTRVVVAITLPELFDSQIIVFFGADYFRKFFDRQSANQKWTVKAVALSRQWHLKLPPGFITRVYSEEIFDAETVTHRLIWFVGQLDGWE